MMAADSVPNSQCMLLLLCGLPATGKSSLAAALASIGGWQACSRVDYDAHLARALGDAEWDVARWHASRLCALAEVVQVLRTWSAASADTSNTGATHDGSVRSPPHRKNRRILIVDDNLHLASMRKQLVNLAKSCTSLHVYPRSTRMRNVRVTHFTFCASLATQHSLQMGQRV